MASDGQAPPIDPNALVNTFNNLFEQTPQDRQLYRPPDTDDIPDIYQERLLKDPKGQEYPLCCELEEFQVFGPGVYLLFKLLKNLAVVMLVVSAVGLVSLILLAVGDYFREGGHATSFADRIAIISWGNVDSQYQTAVPFLHFVCLLAFTAFMVYWKEREPYEVIDCSTVKVLPSYYTAILEKLPEGYTEFEMKNFIEDRFGDVKEIFSVKDFRGDLDNYQEITQTVENYKRQKFMLEQDRDEQQEVNCLKLVETFHEFKDQYSKVSVGRKEKYKSSFAFLTFRDIATRQKLVTTYNTSSSLFPCCSTEQTDPQFHYKKQNLQVRACTMEPDAISWENLSLSTSAVVGRFILQLLLLFVVLVVSVMITYSLALAQTSLKESNFLLQISLPLIISLLRFLFAELMKALVSVRRHATLIKKIQSQIVITFIFYFTLAGLLQLLLYIEIAAATRVSLNRFLFSLFRVIYDQLSASEDSMTLFNDFTREWYLEVSDKVLLISVISFNVSAIFDIFYVLMRERIVKIRASMQRTTGQMNEILKAYPLQIEFIYALALNMVFFTLLFTPVLPILWPCAWLNFTLMYWVQKLVFVRFCQPPLVYSHSISHIVTRIIFFGIVFSCGTVPLLLGGIDGTTIGQRYMDYLYFPILGGVVLLYMFYKRVFLWMFGRCREWCCSAAPARNDRLPTLISSIRSINNQLPSYSMHSNPTYQPILRVLYTLDNNQRNRGTFILNQQLNDHFQQQSLRVQPQEALHQLVSEIKKDKKEYFRAHPEESTHPYDSDTKVKEILSLDEQTQANRSRLFSHMHYASQLLTPSDFRSFKKSPRKTHKNSQAQPQESERRLDGAK